MFTRTAFQICPVRSERLGDFRDGRTDEALALAGIEALSAFIKEIGLPATLKELGVTDKAQLKEIANSCGISEGSYKK